MGTIDPKIIVNLPDEELKDRVKDLAEKTNRSISHVCREAIKRYLDEMENGRADVGEEEVLSEWVNE